MVATNLAKNVADDMRKARMENSIETAFHHPGFSELSDIFNSEMYERNYCHSVHYAWSVYIERTCRTSKKECCLLTENSTREASLLNGRNYVGVPVQLQISCMGKI